MMKKWNQFWFEYEILRVRLTLFRVVFFSVLALDLWILMLPHASRYGINHFNVSHISVLNHLLPTPTVGIMSLCYIVGGFLSLCVAFGVFSRASLIGLTILYNGAYFWSQIDSYQHHYLICLLLILCIFLPLNKLHGLDYPAHKGAVIKSWAAKLIYVEVSIVYFYTAITKTNEHWLNGWTLDHIIKSQDIRQFMSNWREHTP